MGPGSKLVLPLASTNKTGDDFLDHSLSCACGPMGRERTLTIVPEDILSAAVVHVTGNLHRRNISHAYNAVLPSGSVGS